MPALFLSRESSFYFSKIFSLDNMHMLFEFFFARALLPEFYCVSVIEFSSLSTFVALLFRTTSI